MRARKKVMTIIWLKIRRSLLFSGRKFSKQNSPRVTWKIENVLKELIDLEKETSGQNV